LKKERKGGERLAKKDEENSTAKRWDTVVFGRKKGNIPVHQRAMLSFFQLEVIESASGLKRGEDVRKGGGDSFVEVEVVSEEVVDSVLRHADFLLKQAEWGGKRGQG